MLANSWNLLLRLAFVGLLVVFGGYVLTRAERLVRG